MKYPLDEAILSVMNRLLSSLISLLLFFTAIAVPAPASAAAKPIKSNFTKMTDLLASLKAKGVTCSPYKKTPAELVIEEGKCRFQGTDILIDLWPKEKTAKDFADAMKKVAAYYIEIEFWPVGSKMFIFYSNNYILSIDGLTPEIGNAEKVANVIQKRLGIKYTVGTSKKIESKVKNDSVNPLPTPSKTPAPPLKGTWASPFTFGERIKNRGFSFQPISIETGVTTKVCADSAKREQDFPDDWDYSVTGALCPQSGSQYSADQAKIDDYAKFTFEYKNETDQINYPGDYLVRFRVTDSQGKIYKTVLISYEDSKSLSIDVVPGGSVMTSVFFQLPRTFKKEGARLEMDFFDGEPTYWFIP